MTITDLFFPQRPKAFIMQIGYVDENNEPKEWIFDCFKVIPHFEITETGEKLYAGYTIEELKRIGILH